MIMDSLNVNIVCMDHYMHYPLKDFDPLLSDFRSSSVEKVPVLRIFGSTYEGIKACAHIHGVFPYFYIRCPSDQQDEKPQATSHQLANALDKAINITMNQANSSQQHIFNISIEDGIPFYGYHETETKFFKISLYNPLLIKKASAILQSGSILGASFQPYECHIPYKQQFMIDFNLFGMNFVRFEKHKLRDDIVRKKQSVCPLEFDVCAKDIRNQYDIMPENIACNPGIQYIRDEEIKRAKENGDDGKFIIEPNLTQNRYDIEPTASDIAFRSKLKAILKANEFRSRDSTQTDSFSCTLSNSLLEDTSMHDNTVLEEHVQLFMNLYKATDKEHESSADFDADCILSQKPSAFEQAEDNEDISEFNLSLNQCISLTPLEMESLQSPDKAS